MQTGRLVRLGCIPAVLALLHTTPAPGILNISLRTLVVLFEKGDASLDLNPYAAEFQRAGGEPILHTFRQHHWARIAACAATLLRTYFDPPPSTCGSPTSVVDSI